MNEFDFGLSDIVQSESGGRSLGRGVAGFLAVTFFVLSAITTFGFFANYAAAVGAFAGPDAAPLVAGVVGVLLLDAGALGWSYVRSHAATSAGQMTVALVAATADLLMSLATSSLYVILSTTLETGIRDAAGVLTSFGQTVNYSGVAVITASLIVNFASVFLWQHLGADTRHAAQQTELRAVVAEGRYRVDNARAKMTVARTIEAIKEQLPAEADALAGRQRAAYLEATMRRAGAHPHPDVVPSANGVNGASADASFLAR